MEKFVRIAIVVLFALAILGLDVWIGYALVTEFCWAGLLYVPVGLMMWAIPYFMYELLFD